MLTTGCPPFLRPVVVGRERVVRGCGGGAVGGGGGSRAGPAAGRVARRSGPAPALAPFPVPGRSSLWTIPLFHTISASPPKQSRMVGTFLKVHTRPRLAYALRCRGYRLLNQVPINNIITIPPFDLASPLSVRSRTVTPYPAPQVDASLASDESGPTCSQEPPTPSCSC